MLKRVEAKLGFKSNVEILLECAHTGRELRTITVGNLIVTDGRNIFRDLLLGSLPTVAAGTASHFAVGTDNTPVTAADVALAAEVFRASMTATSTGVAQARLKFFLSSGQANGNTLVEAGLLNDPTAGTLIGRIVHDAIVKTDSIQVTYNWTIDITAS